MKTPIFLIIIFFSFVRIPTEKLCSQEIFINEIMSDNNSCIFDQDGDSSDWIELYNRNENEAINLHQYRLSDDPDILDKWMFPSVNIQPQGTLLIFASDKNITTENEIHTNFKISSNGECLYLSNNQGIIIDSINPIHLGEDNSYGRLPDGTSNLIHLDVSTPNSSNNNTSQVVFSEQSGFYNQPFNLHLNSLIGDTIYYSLDGSIPSQDSHVFEDSIFIYNRGSEPNYFSEFRTTLATYWLYDWTPPEKNIDKANIIRCISYKNGAPSSRVYTQTYFVDKDGHERYNLPIISLVTEESNFFDSDSGIYVPGVYFDKNSPDWTGNYFQKGRIWEKPVHIEYFDKQGDFKFSQDAGIRIHGGKSRGAPQKSLRLYAREDYGKKHFNYQLLPKTQNTEYKRFILRNPMGCHQQSVIKDVLAHDIVKDLNIETQDFQPAIVFLNGEYWGLHTIRDYIDENYINYKYDNSDSVRIVSDAGAAYEHFNNIFEFIEKNNLNQIDGYEYIKTQIDIDNYITYQILEMFFQNYDWPGNNIKFWRFEDDLEKRWRWIFYDLDLGLKHYDYNMFIHCVNTNPETMWPNSVQSTFPFRKLIEYPQFVDQFINRASELLNSSLKSTKTIENHLQIKNSYSQNILPQINRWNVPRSYADWENSTDSLMYFLNKRPCEFAKQLTDFFNLLEFNFNCDQNNQESRIKMSPNPNNGIFSIRNVSSDMLNGDIFIFNSTGNLIYQKNDFSLLGYESQTVDCQVNSSGMFFLCYVNEENIESISFFVLK